MPKLTQKVKLQEAFLFAQRVKSTANHLDYICKDDDYNGGQRIAKQLIEEADKFLVKLK